MESDDEIPYVYLQFSTNMSMILRLFLANDDKVLTINVDH